MSHPYRDPPEPPPRAIVYPVSWRARVADGALWLTLHVGPIVTLVALGALLVATPLLEWLVAIDLFVAAIVCLLVLVVVALLLVAAAVAVVWALLADLARRME
jgi:hypothetical protein